MQLAPSDPSLPLAVDLDGTLIRTDVLIESINQLLTQRLFQLFGFFRSLLRGRAALKAWLAQRVSLDVASLPYHAPLLQWLQDEKQRGRSILLVTATHHKVARQIADHLGVFDEVLATTAQVNLKGATKRDALVARFGAGGFEYVGNDAPDLRVWEAAAAAHVVTDSAALLSRVKEIASVGHVFPGSGAGWAPSILKALRLHQWSKNLLVFVPLLTAHLYGDLGSVQNALLAFLAFSLAASSVYVLNDLVDVQDDRHHPRKSRRPFASGSLSLLTGWILWPVLLLSAFALVGAALPVHFAAVLGVYVALTTAYSFWLKRTDMLDVLTLAVLYTLRIVGGAAALAVQSSFWLLLFSMFIFLSLALIKRYCELRVAREKGRKDKLRGRGYAAADLEMVSSLGGSAGFISVLVLALYIQDARTATLYPSPVWMWALCPAMLYWIARAWLIAHRGNMHDDPIVFALKDKVSWALFGVMGVLLALARAG